MKAKGYVKNNDINQHADGLTDLPVTDEQAQQAKGGTSSTSNNQAFFNSMVSQVK